MFTPVTVFSSFSTDNLDAAEAFYGQTLGLPVKQDEMGLHVTLQTGTEVFIYPKEHHEPASFTVLNFVVEDLDKAVDELNQAGVKTKLYADGEIEGGMDTDEKGIMRGGEQGPDIAWFKDPAGNVLGVFTAIPTA